MEIVNGTCSLKGFRLIYLTDQTKRPLPQLNVHDVFRSDNGSFFRDQHNNFALIEKIVVIRLNIFQEIL